MSQRPKAASLHRLVYCLLTVGWPDRLIRSLLSKVPAAAVDRALRRQLSGAPGLPDLSTEGPKRMPRTQRLDEAYRAYQADPSQSNEDALYLTVQRFAASIVSRRLHEGDRDNVTSDITLNVFRSVAKRPTLTVPFSAWVAAIASKRISNALRKRRSEIALASTPLSEQTMIEPDPSASDATQRAWTDVVGLDLTPKQETLLRAFIATPDYASLAAQLGIPATTLRNRLQRIKAKCETARYVGPVRAI